MSAMKTFLTILLAVTAAVHALPEEPQCPTAEELLKLRNSIDGRLTLPEDEDYWEAGEMKSANYNRDFNLILYAKSQEDVKKFVKFVRRFGMRPTVRSSGHDYIGRSGADNTCNLSFQKFKEITVNLHDQESSTGASMRVSSGNAWLDVYQEADRQKKLIVGGSAHTVAVGGYLQGGGHSPLSPKLGLGVDQIISFTMVTVDGDVMEVKSYGYTFENGTFVSDPEVFRAVMGGGGGVFGFVTYFRMKLHEPPSDGFVGLSVSFALSTPKANFSDIVMAKFSEMFLNLNESWGGFFQIRPDSLAPELYKGSINLVLLHWGGYDKAKSVIDDIKAFRPDLQPIITVTNYSTFYEYEKDVFDETGYRAVVANRFLKRKDFQPSAKLQKLVGTSLDYGIDIGCTGVLMGYKASEPNIQTSVSKDFRNARMAFSCGTGWGYPDEDEYYEKQFGKFIEERLYMIGEGTYYNEPHPDLPNWKLAYWGTMENYNRLLAVKKKLDPQNVLWCHHCVGSDETEFDTPCPSGIGGASSLNPIAVLQVLLASLIITW